jgi:hypothetical protein
VTVVPLGLKLMVVTVTVPAKASGEHDNSNAGSRSLWIGFFIFSPSGISKTRNQRLVLGGSFYRGGQF